MARKKKKYEDCYIYIALLTTLVIFLEALKPYTFRIANVNLSYSLIGLPLVYFISNYICKKYDYKKAVAAIAISGVVFVCFDAIVSFALGERLMLSSISGEFCAYVISQFVNLTIYVFITNNIDNKEIFIYINYLFSLVTYYMIYTLINLSKISLDTYWKGYFITLIIQIIICIPLTLLNESKK